MPTGLLLNPEMRHAVAVFQEHAQLGGFQHLTRQEIPEPARHRRVHIDRCAVLRLTHVGIAPVEHVNIHSEISVQHGVVMRAVFFK